jgi:hypothetical protein
LVTNSDGARTENDKQPNETCGKLKKSYASYSHNNDTHGCEIENLTLLKISVADQWLKIK